MASLPTISASDLRPVDVSAPAIQPLNVGQLFIDAYQKTNQVMMQRQAMELEQQKAAAEQENQAWNNQYLRPLKIQEAQLGLANAGAALATKGAQTEYYKAKAQNEIAKAATQQAIYGTIDAQIQALLQPEAQTPEAPKAQLDTTLEPTMPDAGAALLLPSPDGKPPGTWTPTTSTPQTQTPALPSPEEYARGLTNDAKDQAHIVQIVNLAKSGDFDALKKLSPVDQEYALRGAGMVDAQGKPLPVEQWGKAPPATPAASPPSPTVEGNQPPKIVNPIVPMTKQEHPLVAKVNALEASAKALPANDPKAQTAKLALNAVKQSPQFKAALEYESGRKATLEAADLIRFAKEGQLNDYATNYRGVDFTLITDKDGNAVDMVDPKTRQPLSNDLRTKIVASLKDHAEKFDPTKAKPWTPPESLMEDYRNYAAASVELNAAAPGSDEANKARAKMEASYQGMIARAAGDPKARDWLAKVSAASAKAAPPTVTPSPAATPASPSPTSPTGVSRDEALRRADELVKQADAMEQKAFDAWNPTSEDGGASGEADYNAAVKKAAELRKQAETIKAQASSAITSIKPLPPK